MSDDDLEKKMEMGLLEEFVTRFAQATADRFQLTDKRIEEHDERMSALVNAHIQTEESQKKTEESLRNLIAVVDRYFSAGRNGQSEV